MGKGRLEAFSDGVIAIIITIMVLELKTPRQPTWPALGELWPIGLSYVLSFFFVGVYWTNHHHLLHTAKRVTGSILWLNLHLLFWMSLIPFVTRWLGETYPSSVPTLAYGGVTLGAGIAYTLLQLALAGQQTGAELREGHRRQSWKSLISVALYASAVTFAWFGVVLMALILYMLVAISWILPERGFERGANEA
jgi:uncharacterized membrane protein